MADAYAMRHTNTSDDNARLGIWTKMVQKIGFPAALTLILLSVVLSVMGAGGMAFMWIGNNLILPSASRHFELVDSVIETNKRISENTSAQTEIQRSNANALWKIKEEQAEFHTTIKRLADVLEVHGIGKPIGTPAAQRDGGGQ